jgi:hypothetical protein
MCRIVKNSTIRKQATQVKCGSNVLVCLDCHNKESLGGLNKKHLFSHNPSARSA